MKVSVANGEMLQTQELCKKAVLELQGLKQKADFLVLLIQSCDLVLGIQWLKTLGPIIWDFNEL